MLKKMLINLPKIFDAGEIKTGVEFELVVVGVHIGAEFVKGLVVLFLFEVGELMDDDHP